MLFVLCFMFDFSKVGVILQKLDNFQKLTFDKRVRDLGMQDHNIIFTII